MRPLWKDFLLLVMQPLLNKSTTPLENISEWIPKSLWSCRAFRTASGMLPIPICSVAPSLTRFSAISLPIFVSTSEILPVSCSGRSSQISVAKSKCDLWMMPSPKVRGILGLICAGRRVANILQKVTKIFFYWAYQQSSWNSTVQHARNRHWCPMSRSHDDPGETHEQEQHQVE